jgi:hypothetical protein
MTWCQPAISNDRKPNRLSWLPGYAMPASLRLQLPFYSISNPV